MKKIILLLLCLLPLLSFSQQWCTPGSTWYYGPYNAEDDVAVGYIKITYVGDTAINSVICNKLIRKEYFYSFLNYTYDTVTLGETYTYSTSNVVYMYGRNMQFDTLYDFAATPGTKWTQYGPAYYGNKCDSTGIIEVDSIGTVTINSKPLRYICVSPIDTEQHWGMWGKIIEQVGPIETEEKSPNGLFFSYMLPQKLDFCGMQIDAVQEGADFRCYSDSSGFFYKGDTVTVACDDIPTSIPELLNVSYVHISPNPSNGIFTVALQGVTYKTQIKVYNTLGQMVLEEPLNRGTTEISLMNCTPGVYLYRIIPDGSAPVVSGKLIKLTQ